MKKIEFTDYIAISGYEGYFYNKALHPCLLQRAYKGCQYMRPLTVYNEENPELAYVKMRVNPAEPLKRVYMKNLLGYSAYQKRNDGNVNVISFNQMQTRTPLTRMKILNYLLRERPEVQVPLTPGSNGEYSIGRGMKELGMTVCPMCGNIQPLEFKLCKHCNHFITI